MNQGDASDTQDSAAGKGQERLQGRPAQAVLRLRMTKDRERLQGRTIQAALRLRMAKDRERLQGWPAQMNLRLREVRFRGHLRRRPAQVVLRLRAARSIPPAADGTTEGGESVDEAVTKPVNARHSCDILKEENSWYKSPFIWIGIATVLAVIGILGYHLKKR